MTSTGVVQNGSANVHLQAGCKMHGGYACCCLQRTVHFALHTFCRVVWTCCHREMGGNALEEREDPFCIFSLILSKMHAPICMSHWRPSYCILVHTPIHNAYACPFALSVEVSHCYYNQIGCLLGNQRHWMSVDSAACCQGFRVWLGTKIRDPPNPAGFAKKWSKPADFLKPRLVGSTATGFHPACWCNSACAALP
jgi:hypothetical protein